MVFLLDLYRVDCLRLDLHNTFVSLVGTLQIKRVVSLLVSDRSLTFFVIAARATSVIQLSIKKIIAGKVLKASIASVIQ